MNHELITIETQPLPPKNAEQPLTQEEEMNLENLKGRQNYHR